MKAFSRVLYLVLAVVGGPGQAQETITNPLGMVFVRIPAGEFVMGTEDLAGARREIPEPASQEIGDEAPAHRVIITRPFYLAQTELTQGVWYQVMGSRPGPEAFWQGEDWARLPLAAASWDMAQRFIEALNRMDPHDHYRLPTEAEWEYAARAGSADLRPMPKDRLQDYAWFIANSADHRQPQGKRLRPVRHAGQCLGVGGRLVRSTDLWHRDPCRPPGSGERARPGPSRRLLSLPRAPGAPRLPQRRPSIYALLGAGISPGCGAAIGARSHPPRSLPGPNSRSSPSQARRPSVVPHRHGPWGRRLSEQRLQLGPCGARRRRATGPVGIGARCEAVTEVGALLVPGILCPLLPACSGDAGSIEGARATHVELGTAAPAVSRRERGRITSLKDTPLHQQSRFSIICPSPPEPRKTIAGVTSTRAARCRLQASESPLIRADPHASRIQKG